MVAQTQKLFIMQAYYYCITRKDDDSVVDEGIITESEDNIYPGQRANNEEFKTHLPYECECHHFSHPECNIKGWYIELTRDDVRQKRSK